jgi:MFS family permease
MGTLPLAMVVFLVSNGTLFLLLYAIVAVVTIPLIAYFTTAVQMVTPRHLRGRVTALTSIPLALIGSLGPLVVGALTDFVFRDEARLGWSLAAVMSTMIPIAILCMRRCLPALRAAVDANEAPT